MVASALLAALAFGTAEPPSCPQGAPLEARVRARATVELDTAVLESVQVELVSAPQGMDVIVRIGKAEARRLQAANCDEALDAAAVVIATSLTPAMIPEPPPSASTPAASEATERPKNEVSGADPHRAAASEQTPTESAEPPPGPSTPIPSGRPRADVKRAQWHLGLGLAGLWGPIEGGQLETGARIARDTRRFRVDFAASYGVRRQVDVPGVPGAHVAVDRAWLTARACGKSGGTRVWAPWCGAADVGFVTAAGHSPLQTPRRAFAPWLALGLDSGVSWAVSRYLTLHAEVGGRVLPSRPRFVVAEAGAACCERWGVRAGASAEIALSRSPRG